MQQKLGEKDKSNTTKKKTDANLQKVIHVQFLPTPYGYNVHRKSPIVY